MTNHFRIFSGRSNLPLAQKISRKVKHRLNKIEITDFPDSEIHIKLKESVRGRDVFIIQSLSRFANHSVNDALMELCLILDAVKRASAKKVVAIIPYLGYARQEKMITGREPISARLAIDNIVNAGADGIVAFDLHSPAIQGFAKVPFDNLTPFCILVDYWRKKKLKNAVIVSPDAGRARLADKYAKALNLPLVLMHKGRVKDKVKIELVAGEIKGKIPIITDDLIAGGSIINHVKSLIELGAKKEIYISITHPAFCGKAKERLSHSAIKEIVTTDTIDVLPEYRFKNIKFLSVSSILAEAIDLIHKEKSIKSLYLANYL
ncbi:ribose-phosphate pyrophosphokinase [Patescibacteria group bacterium]|nr:ribose-phosphate pyrophosphokinase [Patescibacteria group bacterium]